MLIKLAWYLMRSMLSKIWTAFIFIGIVITLLIVNNIDAVMCILHETRYKQPQAYILGSITLLGITLALVTLYYNRKAHKEKNALDFDSDFKGSTIALKSMTRIRKWKDRNCIVVQAEAAKIPSHKYGMSLDYILNSFESMANAVRAKDLIAEDYIFDIYCTMIIGICQNYRTYIFHSGAVGDDKRTFANLVWLGIRWYIRRARDAGEFYDSDLRKAEKYMYVGIKYNKPVYLSAAWKIYMASEDFQGVKCECSDCKAIEK